MNKIRDWLYIGNYNNAKTAEVLADYQIGAILQLFQPVHHKNLAVKFIPIQEGIPLPADVLEDGIQFILEQKQAGKIILVSCASGISRSTTFTIAALKKLENRPLEDIYFDIRGKHPKALPDAELWESLRNHFGEGRPFWDIWREILMRDIE